MTNGEPLRFDLTTGQVKTDSGERWLLIPLSALDELTQTAGAASAGRLARSLGVSIGRRAATKLGSIDGVRGASLEAFVSELAFEVAVSGWGSLTLERWGKALVLVLDHAPVKEHGVVASLLEGAIEAAAGREVHGAALAGEGPVRVLLASEKTAEQARLWSAEGIAAGEVIARLHASGSEGARS
jgi:ribosomal protein L18